MEENTTIVFGIGVGNEINATQFSKMTSMPKNKTQYILPNVSQLLQDDVQSEIHNEICGAVLAYNVRLLC